MIEQKTVLVLGAGASKPYGLPLGYELTWQIKNVLKGGIAQRVPNAILKVCDEKAVAEFCEVFSRSGQPSIDNFLAHSTNKEHWRIGKLIIAAIIKHQESETNLFYRDREDEDHWYEYLWGRLSKQVGIVPWENFHRNQLSVITFNYDRSLETYLTTVMHSTYGKCKEECEKKLDETIKIEHVYGSLKGPYGAPQDGEPYHFSAMALDESANNLRVIAEDRKDDDAVLQRCHDLLLAADRIAYLGFSFDPMNMERLKAADTSRTSVKRDPEGTYTRLVWGTGLSLRDIDRRAIQNTYGLEPPLFLPPVKSLDLLQEHHIFGSPYSQPSP